MRRLLYAVGALTVSVDFAAAEPLVTETGSGVERAREVLLAVQTSPDALPRVWHSKDAGRDPLVKRLQWL